MERSHESPELRLEIKQEEKPARQLSQPGPNKQESDNSSGEIFARLVRVNTAGECEVGPQFTCLPTIITI